uniref:Uncharacterized protein n=1 Tax=Davidia involucrata TaxID=16924 RepID=A0A5B6YKT9_DAVIN
MALHQFLDHPNQVRDSIRDIENRHGRSKAQMCLQKILDLISSHASLRPCESSEHFSLINPRFDDSELKVNGTRHQNRALFCGKRGFDIDLNIRFGSPPETEESESAEVGGGMSASSAVGIGDGQGCAVGNCNSPVVSAEDECDTKEVQKLYGSDFPEANENEEESISAVVDEQEVTEFAEITNLQLQSSETDNNGVSEETKGEEDGKIKSQEDNEHVEEESRSEGCLGLLIEAAKLISGDFDDDEPVPEKPRTETDSTSRRSKRSHCWMMEDLYGEFEDVSPVVRSKRGRSQVLPYRYRDSVLEPLTRQKSTKVSTKRRSK